MQQDQLNINYISVPAETILNIVSSKTPELALEFSHANNGCMLDRESLSSSYDLVKHDSTLFFRMCEILLNLTAEKMARTIMGADYPETGHYVVPTMLNIVLPCEHNDSVLALNTANENLAEFAKQATDHVDGYLAVTHFLFNIADNKETFIEFFLGSSAPLREITFGPSSLTFKSDVPLREFGLLCFVLFSNAKAATDFKQFPLIPNGSDMNNEAGEQLVMINHMVDVCSFFVDPFRFQRVEEVAAQLRPFVNANTATVQKLEILVDFSDIKQLYERSMVKFVIREQGTGAVKDIQFVENISWFNMQMVLKGLYHEFSNFANLVIVDNESGNALNLN